MTPTSVSSALQEPSDYCLIGRRKGAISVPSAPIEQEPRGMGTLLVRLRVSPSGTFQVAEDRDSRRPSLERRRSRLKASRARRAWP
jgi:hypothetical protein